MDNPTPPIIIVLDHVKPENRWKIPDRRGGRTFYAAGFLGADGRERDHQDYAAELLAKILKERHGVDVKIIAPETFGSYDAYDDYIRDRSNENVIIIPLHFDAEVGRGGVGFLTRVRPGDKEDKKLAERISIALKVFQNVYPQLGNFKQTDSLPNKTLAVAQNAPATLIELGSMVHWEREFGDNFTETREFRDLIILIADSLIKKGEPKVVPLWDINYQPDERNNSSDPLPQNQNQKKFHFYSEKPYKTPQVSPLPDLH